MHPTSGHILCVISATQKRRCLTVSGYLSRALCQPRLTAQGLVVFNIDGEQWTLDLRTGSGKAYKGTPENDEKPDLTLTISDDNFVKLVLGKLGSQQVSFAQQMSEVHTASQQGLLSIAVGFVCCRRS